ncbi:MAG: glycosyltransferase family 39 protein, partial [Deltaproteobacteria bacterium]|nr:glycosyltransferase family 39 protein [Deltaproteobacteria bacterium]
MANLHSPWTPLPWLVGIVIWACYFWSDRVEADLSIPESTPFPYRQFLFVLAAATVLRLYKLTELPLGPYVDEVLTLNNSLGLLNRPFDLFGHTPLLWQGWVETANLYLYFDLLILKVFGVSYWSMKLLSVIPGIIACAAVFLICQLLFNRRVAFGTALLFALAHWPVRLSRYGWDVSFMVMTFALAIWLLLLALQRGRPLYAYLSGITTGLCLYSYLGSRICALSLVAFLFLEWLLGRSRWIVRHGIAFTIGAGIVVHPLFSYYLSKPGGLWVRTAELSVFNSNHPFMVIVDNLWRHALMFNVLGGTYARDNYPGLAMIDPLTGLLFIGGLVALVRNINISFARLIGCTVALNFIPGVFSVSQEGAPYVYRTAAVMIPAFLIVGLGLQWCLQQLESRLKVDLSHWKVQILTWPALLLTLILNLYLYFGLEPTNAAAMRVMAYEPRLIGLEIAQDNWPVFLVGRDILDQTEIDPKPGEQYALANPPLMLPPEVRKLAVINFSGRYDLNQTLSSNFEKPKDIYFVQPAALETDSVLALSPAKIIFKSGNRQLAESIRRNYPGASVRAIRNIRGESLLTVVTLLEP